MKTETYTFTISPQGAVKMEYQGEVGTNCIEATKEIEVALGGRKVDGGCTDDYYKSGDPQPATIKW